MVFYTYMTGGRYPIPFILGQKTINFIRNYIIFYEENIIKINDILVKKVGETLVTLVTPDTFRIPKIIVFY